MITSTCPTNQVININTAYRDLILPFDQQKGILGCYCQQILDSHGEVAMNVLFEDQNKHCLSWFNTSTVSYLMSVWVAIYFAGFNLLVQVLLNWCGSLQRSKNMYAKQRTQTALIFCSQFFNMCVIYLICHVQFKDLSQRTEVVLAGTFSDFTSRWYQVVATPIVLLMLFQIVTPHFGLLLYIAQGFRRCFDRKITFDDRITRQVIQRDYEDLYTGPSFDLQVRLSQILFLVFTCLTFSSGLPILYPIAFVTLFVMYWVDKFLLLRFYRLTPGFTKHLSNFVVQQLPFALFFHFLFGFFMFSYPNLLHSTPVTEWLGISNPNSPLFSYLNTYRLQQLHMVIYLCVCLSVSTLILFEQQARRLWSGLEDTRMLTFSNDIYQDLNFSQLYIELKKTIFEYQRLKYLIKAGRYTQHQLDKYVNKYVNLVKRNQKNIYNRLLWLSEQHIDRIEGVDVSSMNDKEKIRLVNQYYCQAIDKDNPHRQ